MKKYLCLILCIIFVLSLAACGSENEVNDRSEVSSNTQSTESVNNAGGKVDLDLTAMSSTMVYSEVSNIMTSPEEYTGKLIKMRGAFSVYTDELSGKNYFACLISDATACCSQGIEFVLAGDHKYPDDYPAEGEEITVTGVFGTYSEGDNNYCQLTDAVIG